MNPDSSDEMVDHLVDFFDRIAPVYDTWAGGQHARVAGRLVDLAAPTKHGLGLGGGTGTGLGPHLVAPRVSPRPGMGTHLAANTPPAPRAHQTDNAQVVGTAAAQLGIRP